jgi:hypothetical protein
LSRLRFRTPEDVIAPQSAEEPVSAVPSGVATTTEAPQHADTLADMSSLIGPTNLVYFGETIRSFRALLRRYCMVELAAFKRDGTTGNAIALQRKAFPIEPGFTSKSNLAPERVTRTVGGKEYAYGYLTPLRFISAGFVGWRGSIRWKVTSSNICCGSLLAPFTVTRYSGCSPANIAATTGDKTTNAGIQSYFVGFDEVTNMQEGAQLVSPTVEPIVSFEVPFYSQLRFLPSRSLTTFAADYGDPLTSKSPCWKMGYELNPPVNGGDLISQHQLYCAAGEDFSLGMFVGAPIVYIESIPPT